MFDTRKQVNELKSFLLQYVQGAKIENVFYNRTEKKYIIFWLEPER